MKTPAYIHALRALTTGTILFVLVGCALGYKDTVADKGIAKDVKTEVETIKSKSSATAGVIKENTDKPAVVQQLAERIVVLNGPATLADVKEAQALLTASKADWDKELAKSAKLADENRDTLSKLNAVMSDLDKLKAGAEEARKDKAAQPFHYALFVSLFLLLYYAVVKKDPIQSALCAAISLFNGFAPSLFDGPAAELLKWVVGIGCSIYAIFWFYDILKTKLGLNNAVLVAESLKKTDVTQTEAVLAAASDKMGAIAKSAIRDTKADLALAEPEATRIFSWVRKEAVSIFGSLKKLFS